MRQKDVIASLAAKSQPIPEPAEDSKTVTATIDHKTGGISIRVDEVETESDIRLRPVEDDSDQLATEEWLNGEFGSEEGSDFMVGMCGDSHEEWRRGEVIVLVPTSVSQTRGNVRKIVAFLRSIEG